MLPQADRFCSNSKIGQQEELTFSLAKLVGILIKHRKRLRTNKNGKSILSINCMYERYETNAKRENTFLNIDKIHGISIKLHNYISVVRYGTWAAGVVE